MANRYLRSEHDPEDRFHLLMVQCQHCGLIQLANEVPIASIVPQHDWIKYNEPEGHLDAVAEQIAQLPGLNDSSVAGGITYKDDSTLARLQRFGIETAWRVDSVVDLEAGPHVGLETIQDRLTVHRARAIATRSPLVDVLLVRHILEHVVHHRPFAKALRELVRPGGYLVFEVPDCTQVLDTLDYTTIWEEHLAYFTPATYSCTLGRLGFDVVAAESYLYPYENSLVAVVRPSGGLATTPALLADELRRGLRFSKGLEHRRRTVQTFLRERRLRGHRTAVFGAGHLSCMFINLMDVAADISFVVDDHPKKRGLLMPGCHVPIRGSEALLDEGIDLCLSTLSPESEEKVVAEQGAFLERGGTFASIFPSSRRALSVPEPVRSEA